MFQIDQRELASPGMLPWRHNELECRATVLPSFSCRQAYLQDFLEGTFNAFR